MRKFLVATGITILFWVLMGLLAFVFSNDTAATAFSILFIYVFSWTIIYMIVKNTVD
jgi:hypothetical protein